MIFPSAVKEGILQKKTDLSGHWKTTIIGEEAQAEVEQIIIYNLTDFQGDWRVFRLHEGLCCTIS